MIWQHISALFLLSLIVSGTALAQDDPRAKWDAQCAAGDAAKCLSAAASWESNTASYTTPVDLAKALQANEAACRLEEGQGCFGAGIMYFEGKGTDVDEQKARDRFFVSCQKDVPGACRYIGTMMMHGVGGDVNEARGVQSLAKACDTDSDFLACYDLGFVYRDARGAAKDEARALSAFKKACQGGPTKIHGVAAFVSGVEDNIPEACNVAGRMLYELTEYSQAYTQFELGCNSGDGTSCHNAAHLLVTTGTDNEENRELSARFYQLACQNGYQSDCTR